ncbi:hypothetical protein EPA93_20180 [Ktedonosporobacter rubrisoli]|uniref:Peptidase C39-like domain-containing protein n=1 Tax=Ktedonosporobacter rubrisoli TaxID=2509675 RepID=A0A4P6JSH7_KTERU|nr:C39 family peptidase [Ktedonosporobacter rubrisoli]QBD78190.1 hypothetical protein EPA93_20180 [Ktedonosporobacter rubrisoli]
MLSAVITALLVVVMLLIVISLIISAWRERRRYQQTLAARAFTDESASPLKPRTTAVLYLQDGNVVSVEAPKLAPPSFTLPSSWYSRRRTLVSLGFLIMIMLTLFMQGGLAGETLTSIGRELGISILSNTHPVDLRPISHPLPDTASIRLVRIDSAARNQYYTNYQWQVWAYSSCSGIAMEMVMNSYGRHLIAADILQEELDLGVWNVQLGLLREEGIAMTAAHYGFKADLSHARTLQDVIDIANKGTPVIVSVRDSHYYPGGHIFVLRGGDGQNVSIADSSPVNFTHMTRAAFLGMWQGFSAVLTPTNS